MKLRARVVESGVIVNAWLVVIASHNASISPSRDRHRPKGSAHGGTSASCCCIIVSVGVPSKARSHSSVNSMVSLYLHCHGCSRFFCVALALLCLVFFFFDDLLRHLVAWRLSESRSNPFVTYDFFECKLQIYSCRTTEAVEMI